MLVTKLRSRKSVGPARSTNSSRTPARPRFMLDSHLMPFDSPVTTEMTAASVMSPMMVTWSSVVAVKAPRTSRPALICSTPKPRELATPKSVETTARVSTASPIRPFTRSPSSGSSTQRTAIGRPRRWAVTATARAITA